MREREVEMRLRMQVYRAGGMCFKIAPTTAGLPDRLVICPSGRMLLVELKAPGGKLQPVQREVHKRLAQRGVHVRVLTSIERVDEFVKKEVMA